MTIDMTTLKGYKEPKIVAINKFVTIVVHTPIVYSSDYIDFIEIYNSKEDNYIPLYNTTISSIYTILNKITKKINKESNKKSKK